MSCPHRRETKVDGKQELVDFDLQARRRAIRLGHAEPHVALDALRQLPRVQAAVSPRVVNAGVV